MIEDSYEEKLKFTLRDVDIDEAIRVNDEYTSENAFNLENKLNSDFILRSGG